MRLRTAMLLTILLAGAGLVARPGVSLAETVDWGPGIYSTPTWAALPVVPVVDTLAGTIRPDRLPAYREARNSALQQWGASGLDFVVTEQESSAYSPCDGSSETPFVPGSIRICRNGTDDGYGTPSHESYGGWLDSQQGGIVVLSPDRTWWKSPAYQLRGLIAHEAGHAIGFQHGGTGVMGGNDKVSAQEIQLAHDYYFGNAA